MDVIEGNSGLVIDDELSAAFAAERRGLVAHAYRMLGSWDDAEDVVQDTYLRAARGWDGFRREASTRTWLYRIATNACLTALDGRGRRALPAGLGGPVNDVGAAPESPAAQAWIQPIPTDPAAVAEERDSLRLALIAGLQHLPARQRAVLLLREVLQFSAAEVATMLEMSVAAVKSALQRARATLDGVTPESVAGPSSAREKELLESYMAAFRTADPQALARVLSADATIEMVPARGWFAGRDHCLAFAAGAMDDGPGAWRMTPVGVNGQPGVLAWLHGEPFGAVALTLSGDDIAGIVIFNDPGLVARWR